MAAVVIMACNRADYLDKTIKSVLKYVLLDLLTILVARCSQCIIDLWLY